MEIEKLTPDDFSAHDLEMITEWTGSYFGAASADPYKLIRALYVIGHRKRGIDTRMRYVDTAPKKMKDLSNWVDEHWDLAPDDNTDTGAADSEVPLAGSKPETD